ncbi:PAS domain S-box protein [Paremcibacter congregatus]|uniref:histidine kinase n=1 Tax=Paremcibacter congregatus TaxID=2043170 RepID=A0A2G4YWI4_9PROT|nr:PAS domain S-box protein [Paremcibacter congregatus]PHZ86623.1 hypothetical protein CRD36_01735 [Paremcibacter congregatus]QDE26425.1 PAS domain S-box protein [Paremcibacter congregatus]
MKEYWNEFNDLKENPNPLSEIIAHTVDGIIALDKEQNIVLFNKGAETIFGYSSAEILGRKLNVLLPKEIASSHHKRVENFGKSAKSARLMGERDILYGRAKDGHAVPLDIAIQHHPETNQVRYTAICRDISGRIKRERRLAVQKAKFETLFNSSNRLIFLTDEHGEIQEMNKTACNLLAGYKTSFIGQKICSCKFWDNKFDRALLQQQIAQLEQDNFSRISAKIISAEGKSYSLEVTLKTITVENTAPKRIVIEAMDVTQLAEINEALRKSENSLARAQKIAHLGNWEWNIENNGLEWSDEVFRIFGRMPGSFTVTYPAFIAAIHPDDLKKVEQAVDAAIHHQKTYDIVHRILTPEGIEKVIRERGEVLRDENGHPMHMTGTVQDITESWYRERALAGAQEKAEAANKAKSQFLATMSHELRTPLNAIIGFSGSMQSEIYGALDKQYKEYADYIQQSGQHLLAIINDILDLSRIEVGTIDVRADWIEPERLVEKPLKFISDRAQAKGITVHCQLDPKLRDVFLDERHTTQILINLLTNAVKFSNTGDQITLGVRTSPDEVEFYVQDSGIGMSKESISKVFNPFFQVDMSYSRTHEGVGLGLAIVKELTELQKGRVTISSALGEGTRASVFFPVPSDTATT